MGLDTEGDRRAASKPVTRSVAIVGDQLLRQRVCRGRGCQAIFWICRHNAMSVGVPVHQNTHVSWEDRSAYFYQLRERIASVQGVLEAEIRPTPRRPTMARIPTSRFLAAHRCRRSRCGPISSAPSTSACCVSLTGGPPVGPARDRARCAARTDIAALALGVGVVAATFSIVNAVILRPLPYRDSGRIVMLWPSNAGESISADQMRTEGRSMSGAEFLDWQEKSGIFEQMIAFGSFETTVTGPGDAEMSFGYTTSAGLFPMLGVRPALGRGYLPEEERPGGPSVVVIFESLWRRRYAADPAVIGKQIFLADRPYTIVGVLPREFVFFNRQVEFLAASQWSVDRLRQQRGYRSFRVMGRLKPGMTMRDAQARAEVFAANLARSYPATNRGWDMRLSPLATDSAGPLRPALWMLMGASGCVLLITCLNIANLLLVQTASRNKELAVRSAMGALRGRLVRQLVTESMMLAVVGGVLAAGLAWLLIRYFQSLLPDRYTAGKYLVQVEAIRMDPRVIGFALAAALLTGFVFGFILAWRASKPDMNTMLKDATRGAKGGRRGRRLQEMLVVTEVSIALVMVVGAVLLIRSFVRLYGQSLGMRTQNVISLQTQLPYWEVSARLQKLGLSNEAPEKRWDAEFQTMDGQVDHGRDGAPVLARGESHRQAAEVGG
jgi:predicted permease